MRDETLSKRTATPAPKAAARPGRKLSRTDPAGTDPEGEAGTGTTVDTGLEAVETARTPGARPRPERMAPREPIYLASQLASICDVDLKTIHNWCDRNDDLAVPGELECFRTPGGHLRFRHSSVLRFLTRWGYPVPDSLLRDRPHVLLVEPDEEARRALIVQLRMVRPGDDAIDDAAPEAPTTAPAATPVTTPPSVPPRASAPSVVLEDPGDTLGLWAAPRFYVHLWDDPYAALVALGERTGAGAPPDLAVLTLPLPGLAERAWIHAASEATGDHPLRFVLVAPDETAPAAAAEPGVVSVVPRARIDDLRGILEAQALGLLGRADKRPGHRGARGAQAGQPGKTGQRKRRIPIAPREPIFVASQVANIWDVDLKTVHNWVERGDIEAFRTPGRHLRFRRRSLLHFLRRYNMAIPEDLVPHRPRVMVIDPDEKSAKRLAQSLGELFDVVLQPDPVVGLAEVGGLCAGAGLIDAVVVAFPVAGVDDRRWLGALARHPDTRYSRVVVISGDESRHRAWQELGVIATVERKSLDQVALVLERALGLNH